MFTNYIYSRKDVIKKRLNPPNGQVYRKNLFKNVGKIDFFQNKIKLAQSQYKNNEIDKVRVI